MAPAGRIVGSKRGCAHFLAVPERDSPRVSGDPVIQPQLDSALRRVTACK
jgi:hypothetical protein